MKFLITGAAGFIGSNLADAAPEYRDFRPGDVRHSLADITKANALMGYTPTHRIGQGLTKAMTWYEEKS
jgi:UDP-N-acetylglucosamine 4-epimerase